MGNGVRSNLGQIAPPPLQIFSHTFSKESFYYISENRTLYFRSQTKLFISNSYIFLYFRKWNSLALIFYKNSLYFLKRKHFLYFLKRDLALKNKASKKKIYYASVNGNHEKILIFQETETLKKVLLFQEATCNSQTNKTNKKVCVEEISCLLWRFCNLTSVEHMEISCEVKNKNLMMFAL